MTARNITVTTLPEKPGNITEVKYLAGNWIVG